ncbi:hypothetical protein K3495_g11122 [Podosphaera aphanis]|nr:hypothetical protein K3495_g11122 [Podosphaera aphanis]
MNQRSITKQLGISRNQVRYTFCTPYIEPKKAAGGPPTLFSSDVVWIEAFITSSSEGRRMSWFELVHGPFRDFGVSERVIQHELKKGSYGYHPALKKPPLLEEVKRKRREWAEAHKDWTVEDWMAVLWTDETWATDGQHKRDWVPRKFKIGEEINATCVVEKVRKSLGWMFWGSFAGIEEGPCLFWEKEWGSITS